jgi:hypothetical protein
MNNCANLGASASARNANGARGCALGVQGVRRGALSGMRQISRDLPEGTVHHCFLNFATSFSVTSPLSEF